jgi:predicted NBD/HSP70 family sugar kinase
VVVYMSQGIGCGIVINGTSYRGFSGNAGEIGHTSVDGYAESARDGVRCWCGLTGCLETVASPRAVVRQVLEDRQLSTALDIDEDTSDDEVYRRFTQRAASGGDPAVDKILTAASNSLAGAVANVVNTLDLDLVVLAGSGYAGVGRVFQAAVQSRVERTAFTRELHPVTVRLGATGSESAALGAASVVLHRHLTPHRFITTS